MFIVIDEIRPIGLLRILIPLARENTFSTNAFEAQSESANPCKEVDEAEGMSRRGGAFSRPHNLLQQWLIFGRADAHLKMEHESGLGLEFGLIGDPGLEFR